MVFVTTDTRLLLLDVCCWYRHGWRGELYCISCWQGPLLLQLGLLLIKTEAQALKLLLGQRTTSSCWKGDEAMTAGAVTTPLHLIVAINVLHLSKELLQKQNKTCAASKMYETDRPSGLAAVNSTKPMLPSMLLLHTRTATAVRVLKDSIITSATACCTSGRVDAWIAVCELSAIKS